MGSSKLMTVIGIVSFMNLLANAASIGILYDAQARYICSRVFEPVCGLDNVTYKNICVFDCNKKRNKHLEIKFDGACSDKDIPKREPCICYREFRPVCSTHNTFINE